MKRLGMALVMVCALGVVPSGLLAGEDEAPAKPKRERPRKKKPPKKKPLLRGMHAQMAKVCDLAEEQQKKMAELNADRAKASKAWHDENGQKIKALQEEMKKARESKDKEAMKKARDAWHALSAKRNELQKKATQDIMAVLTPEQKAKWDEYQAVLAVKRQLRGAELTDEQVTGVKAAYVKLAAGADTSGEKGRRALLSKLYAEVEKNVLTEDQRTTVAVNRVAGRFYRLKLTDDQKAKIKAAYVKHMTGVDAGDKKAQSAANSKLYAEIRDQILTDEQRDKLPKPKVRKPREKRQKNPKPKPED